MFALKGLRLGELGGPSGVKGWNKLIVEHPQLLKYLENNKWVYVVLQHKPIPFFIECVKMLSEEKVSIKLKGLDQPETAKMYTGLEIQIPEYCIKQADVETLSLDNFEGYTVFDELENEIGKVDALIENKFQILLSVLKDNEELLIPFHSDLVIEVDDKLSRIVMEIPDGLLTLD